MKNKTQYLIGTIGCVLMTIRFYNDREHYGYGITVIFGVLSIVSLVLLLSEITQKNDSNEQDKTKNY